MGRHSFEEHTGEVEIHLEAPALAELFVEAARALAEVMAGPAVAASGPYEAVRLEAPDRDALLVGWLDELLFRAERDKKVFTDVRVERVSDRSLWAAIRGREIEELALHVKGATFHGLAITEGPAGVAANVVLDV